MSETGNTEASFSRCDICNADLGKVRMDTPIYCIACIEEMDRLGMSPARYKRQKGKITQQQAD